MNLQGIKERIDLLEYVQGRGVILKKVGKVYMGLCPLHDDKNPSFSVDPEKQRWNCYGACGKGGDIISFVQEIDGVSFVEARNRLADGAGIQRKVVLAFGGKEFIKPDMEMIQERHENLLSSKKWTDYLYGRGFKDETICYFKLGIENASKIDWLVIPHFREGKPVAVKYRSLPPTKRTFRRMENCESILFNEDCLKDNDEVILAEGEIDAMILWQNGFKNVIATTVGSPGFVPEWYDLLKNKSRIYLAYDNDDAGRKGQQARVKQFGVSKCFNLDFKENDVNDFFVSGKTAQDFQVVVQDAIPFDEMKNVKIRHRVLSESIENEENVVEEGGLSYPWERIHQLAGKMIDGDLIVISAIPKTGKTTFCLNIADHLVKQGNPVLFYCLEMRPERLAKKTVEMNLLKRWSKEIMADIKRFTESCKKAPLYFGYDYQNVNLKSVIATIREATKKYSIKLVVFDNLHFLARDLRNVVQEVGNVSKSFKMLAEELEIPIILVAQPRKIESNRIMTMNDLKDSSAIGADADQVIILWRERRNGKKNDFGENEGSLASETLVRVEASRYHSGGDMMLYFKGEYSKFTEIERKRDEEKKGGKSWSDWSERQEKYDYNEVPF